VAKINHSASLLLNGRAREAEAILKTVPTNTLNRAQMTVYNFDLFETQYRLGRLDQAQAMNEHIEEDYLYPPQRVWLAKVRKELSTPNAREEKPQGKG